MKLLFLIAALQGVPAASGPEDSRVPVTIAVVEHEVAPNGGAVILTGGEAGNVIVLRSGATSVELAGAVRAFQERYWRAGLKGASRREVVHLNRDSRRGGAASVQKPRRFAKVSRVPKVTVIPGVGKAQVYLIMVEVGEPGG